MDQFRTFIVDIATGERRLVYSGSRPLREYMTEEQAELERLTPGHYLQNVYQGKDTTRRYLPADCPHDEGVLVCIYSARINRCQSGFSLAEIDTEPEDVWEWLNASECGGDEESETLDDEEWRFDCDLCDTSVRLVLDEDDHLRVAD